VTEQARAVDRIATSRIVERLSELHPKLIDLSTERIERLLRDLGYPHLELPNVIHVAGTNGKGSTCAFLRALLNEAGYSVNVYTSPHLVSFTERVRLNDAPITEDDFLSILEHCERINAGRQITFFEMLTAAAFLAFAHNPADATIVEVGLGGRFDATNVFPSPAMSVITPVSLDHLEFLGPELSKIAWEKAGILKPKSRAVSASQTSEAYNVIISEASKVGTQLRIEGNNWKITPGQNSFHFKDEKCDWQLPRPSLAGDWQYGNAGLALAALSYLEGFDLTESIARRAMKSVEWPGRLQLLSKGPLVSSLAPRKLWIDGGHNPAAAEALASEINTWAKPPQLIIGMMERKDADSYLRRLNPAVQKAACVPIPNNEGAFEAEALAAKARNVGIDAIAYKSLEAAVEDISQNGDNPVLICGSLYLAGLVLSKNS
jgi:dihydrofolate synthase/folylpolyglutamate synthase